jgi:hypothetical protein
MKSRLIFKSFWILNLVHILLSSDYNAVIVGINDYPGSNNDLSYAVADAQGIREVLINDHSWSSSKISLVTPARDVGQA